MLSLYEELFLLSVDEDKGVTLPSAMRGMRYGLAGAVLAELALQKKVRINEKGRLEVVDPAETGSKILDRVIGQIQATDKPRKLGYWMDELTARPKNMRKLVENSLVARGLLSQDDTPVVANVSTSGNSQPEFPSKYEIKNHLRTIILANGGTDVRSLALLSLAQASRLLYLIFTKDERRFARRCIHEKVIREALGNPAAEVIEEIESAVSDAYADANS